MFWSQVDDNSINDLLIKEDISLEEVLDHESVLQECKIQNEKLIKYLCLKSNFCKLLDYVLLTPSEDIEEKVRFKYPSLVCEVLTSDVREINDLLINGDPIDSPVIISFVDLFLDILSREISINPLILSFSVKILLNILKFNNDKVMSGILKKPDTVSYFLKHADSNAIAVFFTEFLICEDEFSVSRIEWLRRDDFFCKCVLLFDVNKTGRNNYVQALLCEVIGASWKFFTNKEMRLEIRNQINCKFFLDLLFTNLSNPKADFNLITGCLKVVRSIVDLEIESEGPKMTALKEIIVKHLSTIITLLSSPPKQIYDPMPTTIGKITPFGPTRLEIVYLLESLLKLKDSEINDEIGHTNIFMVLMAFVSQYKWNTMFQLGFLRIFDILFEDLSTSCEYKPLLKLLVTDYDVFHWFITVVNQTSESSKPRAGSMGLLWKIGNHLDTLWSSQIAELILNKEEGEEDLWNKVVNTHLRPRNNKNIIITPTIDSCFKDVDINIVDIDDDAMMISNNPEVVSAFFQNKSDNLDDMFGASAAIDTDEWIENELKMPTVPIDNFCGIIKKNKITSSSSSSSSLKHEINNDEEEAEQEEESSSDDEESPSVIKQKSAGKAAKYLLSDVSSNDDLKLFDVPDFHEEEISSLNFDNPWKTKLSEENVHDNWASFSM